MKQTFYAEEDETLFFGLIVMAMDAALLASSRCTLHVVNAQVEPGQLPPHFMHAQPFCATGPYKALLLRSLCSSSSTHTATRCRSRAQQGAESSAAAATSVEGNSANRRSSPLTRGGTLRGEKATGKDPGLAVLGKAPVRSGSFEDARWKHGTWDLSNFTTTKGNIDWDAVIDAEVLRRKWLEEKPEVSLNEDPVVFQISAIPWWAWVRRFHLPEAELLNGRAAMVGFVMGYLIDALTGMGLVEQTSSFAGKLLLLVCVLGIMLVRTNKDVENLKQLAHEWNFYDKQWQATWQDEQVPTFKELK